MKRFIVSIICFLGIPIALLFGLYLCTDPFRCLHSFDVDNIDETNREYLSTELYLMNKDSIHYDSFVFASSRGGGINTYQWKQYLDSTAKPFLFQAWSETLTGEYLKLKYLDELGTEIQNVLLLIDIPGSFSEVQLSHNALDMKHFVFVNSSRFEYNAYQFFNYIQKPSGWIESIKNRNNRVAYCADRITNDYYSNNRFDYTTIPEQDSLKYCSEMTQQSFYTQIKGKTEDDVVVCPRLIDDEFEKELKAIKDILDKHHTNYDIIITPAICYSNPTIHPDDLQHIQDVFGREHVHNYSGVNKYTIDVNDYSDPAHFGRRVGWKIIEEVFAEK